MVIDVRCKQMCQGRDNAVFDDGRLGLVVMETVHQLLRDGVL